MKLMGDSLEMVAGNEIKRMFAKISNKKLIGVGIGTVTTAVVQSSAAIIVMSMGFVNSGLMSLTQAITISYGANIGTCVTALIVAVGVGGFADVQLTVIFAALAGVGAGVFYLMQIPSVSPTLGSMPGIKAFAAAVIGGIGSIPGAMLGGVILGVVEKLALSVPVLAPYATAIEFALLIVILLVRPIGILGKKRWEKV